MGSREEGEKQMNLYRKLECTCGDSYFLHEEFDRCQQGGCACTSYDPAGHNPELENVLCPNCKLVYLQRSNKQYICFACQHTMTEAQVFVIVG